MHSSQVEIDWCLDREKASWFARFFVENVDLTYISHSEMQNGRAVSSSMWSIDCEAQLQNEMHEAMNKYSLKKRVVVAYVSGALAALGIVSQENETTKYATLDDLIVDRQLRGHKIGSEIIKWVVDQLRAEGVREIYLESGGSNEQAHKFFHENAFETCSVVMRRQV